MFLSSYFPQLGNWIFWLREDVGHLLDERVTSFLGCLQSCRSSWIAQIWAQWSTNDLAWNPEDICNLLSVVDVPLLTAGFVQDNIVGHVYEHDPVWNIVRRRISPCFRDELLNLFSCVTSKCDGILDVTNFFDGLHNRPCHVWFGLEDHACVMDVEFER